MKRVYEVQLYYDGWYRAEEKVFSSKKKADEYIKEKLNPQRDWRVVKLVLK